MDSLLFEIMLIIVLGVASQWVAWRFQMPAIVIMSLAGLLVGPMLGIIHPKESFGDLFSPVISLAVAIILFEGSLNLEVKEIKGFSKPVFRIITVGAFIAWICGSLAAHYLAGLSWAVAFVIGGLFIVTGPTVIMPLLRQAKLKARPAAILKWEGIVVDPFGALLALFAFQIIMFINEQVTFLALMAFFAASLFAIFLGFGAGKGLGIFMEKGLVPEFLKSPIVLGFVLLAFTLADMVMHETGLLAVTAMGMTMANMQLSSIKDMRHFKENISVLLISSIFVMLTASIPLTTLEEIFDPRILGFVLAMLFVVRPLSIWISTIGTDLLKSERALIGWIAPRGIVALTVSGYFTTILLENGFEDAEIVTALTLALVFFTVIAHGFSIGWLAKKLNLSSSEQPGVLLVGGSRFSAELAYEIQKAGKPVLVLDRAWERLQPVRQKGVPTYVGDILSEQTEYHLDLLPYEKLIAATEVDTYNALICANLVPELGRNALYQTAIHQGDPADYKGSLGGKLLFQQHANVHELEERIQNGHVMKKTTMTNQYNYAQYVADNKEDAIFLFVLREDGEIDFYVQGADMQVQPGDSVISLAPRDKRLNRTLERLEFQNEN